MSELISIVDYGMGNLHSVQKALQAVGNETQLVSTPAEVEAADKLVLPGVGAFGDAIKGLNARDLIKPLRSYAASGRPLFGICLGMQILFEESEEDPGIEGLGILQGSVRRFQVQGLKVPHMGWNSLTIRNDSPWFQSLGADPCVYFVHSYYVIPENNAAIAATADYGGVFTAAVALDNVGGTQFHPEKSQGVGLQILTNFSDSGAAV